jgi:hypothetical protein
MYKVLFIAICLFLVGCDPVPNKKGKDGYYFEQETFTRTDFPVEVKLMQSEQEMINELKKRSTKIEGKVSPKDVAAFAVIRPNDKKCTIYMLDPKVKYQPEYIGHEFVHCIYGVWHKEPQG